MAGFGVLELVELVEMVGVGLEAVGVGLETAGIGLEAVGVGLKAEGVGDGDSVTGAAEASVCNTGA